MQVSPLNIALAALSLSAVSACASPVQDPKPAADPDVATLQAGKADAVSNWFTTIVGSIDLGDDLKANIDWPDWFHGYTVELSAGQTVEFLVTATETGYVRVYGPAHRWVDGEPRFARALVKTSTAATADGPLTASQFQLEVEEDGTYMLLYGPKFVWQADYKVKATCVGGCSPDGACDGDDACDDDAFCGHNGVVCITYPCDVSFDICQPRREVGDACHRDAMCSEGLVCDAKANVCAIASNDGGLGDACATTDDCGDGFCGCTDSACTERICKPWQDEGQSCGGFTLPQYHTQCRPGLTCASPWWIADLPGVCAVETSPETLYESPEAFDGRVVAVAGHIHTGYAWCTKMACSPDNPCCNNCGASQKLYGAESFPNDEPGVELLDNDGQSYGCGGNECTYTEQCTVQDGEALVIGTFGSSDWDTWVIDVQRQWLVGW